MSESLQEEIRTLRSHFWSDRDPEGRAFAPLADAYRQIGELDEAAELVADGLSRHPDFTSGLLVAARVAADMGDVEAALGHLNRLLELDPENPTALLTRARVSLDAGERDEAERDAERILELEPGHAGALEVLGREGGMVGEEEDVEKAEEVEEEELDPGAHYTRTMGELYERQGLIDSAIDVYEHLVRRAPDNEELRARLEELRDRSRGGTSEEEAAGEDSGEVAVEPEPEAEFEPESEFEVESDFEVESEFEVEAGFGSDFESEFEVESEPTVEPTVDSAVEPAVEAVAEEPGSDRTIGQYLEDILAWVPGAVPIESLAPEVVEEVGEVVEQESEESEMDDEPSFEEPSFDEPSFEEPTDVAETEPAEVDEDSDEETDDFQSWLKSLDS